MILDLNTLLSGSLQANGSIAGQAVTADAASTNAYDLGAPGITPYNGVQLKRQIAGAGCIPLLVQVTEAFATCTSVTATVQSDDDSAFGSPKDLLSETVLLADLVAGKIFQGLQHLPEVKERYIRINYVVNGADATAGKIIAGFVGAVDQKKV